MSGAVPKVRFPEFSGQWKDTTLGEQTESLDGKRVPIKSSERETETGRYPYYGASGIIDYVDDYLFDETLLLLAEDGANITNRSTPVAFLAHGRYWVNNHAHVYRPKGDPVFLVNVLERMDFSPFNTGSTMPKLNARTCDRIPLIIPERCEQEKIGTFLGTVDGKISGLRRKEAALVRFKAGLMQKIFSQKIRFTRDDGSAFPDWADMRLGDFLQPLRERVPAATDLPIYSSSREGLSPQKDYFADYELANEGEYGVVPDGYITYRHMSDDLTFKFNLNTFGFSIAVSKEYPVFTTKGMDIRYLLHWLNNSKEFAKFAAEQKLGGTRTRLYLKSLQELRWSMPHPDEQCKIADALAAMDKKIAAVRSQTSKMETFKKGLLQQMFV